MDSLPNSRQAGDVTRCGAVTVLIAQETICKLPQTAPNITPMPTPVACPLYQARGSRILPPIIWKPSGFLDVHSGEAIMTITDSEAHR